MGIHNFFGWLKKTYPDMIDPVRANDTVSVPIDALLLDMNAIFHQATQKVFKYGEHEPKKMMFRQNPPKPRHDERNEIEVFRQICLSIENFVNMTKPTKRLVLCIDGVAPLSKQNQQRMRRYRSAKDNVSNKEDFNPNSITPGTAFMDRLSEYIDMFVKTKMTESDYWKSLEVSFSSSRSPGEGEHKAISYVRKFVSKDESCCINGMDADLIMLTLASHHEKFYIIRDNTYQFGIPYNIINISGIRSKIIKRMRWKSEDYDFDETHAVNDFVYFCFLCGNDFLPNLPSIEIPEDGLTFIFEIYKTVCSIHGHLTVIHDDGNVKFSKKCLELFFKKISEREKDIFEHRVNDRETFRDEYLMSHSRNVINSSTVNNSEFQRLEVDIDSYRSGYMSRYFPSEKDEQKICHDYIEGTQWVLTYYTKGVPSWIWFYKYHYAPLAFFITKHVSTYTHKKYAPSQPIKPFQQLLCVLPPKSSSLLPSSISSLLTSDTSEIREFCPTNFDIDMSGKRKEYQGIVLLPMINLEKILEAHDKREQYLEDHEKKRNIHLLSISYKHTEPYTFKSRYGYIENCSVKSEPLKF